jgi:hypothetical protein
MLNKPAPIVVNASGPGEFHFRNGEPLPPKWDWTAPANRSRLEAAVIALKGLHRRLDTVQEHIDAKQRSGELSSNQGPRGRYREEPPQDNSAYSSAGEQAAISLKPDVSAGPRRKLTQENPHGTADNDKRRSLSAKIAPSSLLPPPDKPIPLATIIKNISARESVEMANMKVAIATGLMRRGY